MQVPTDMIIRVDQINDGMFWCCIGWPTDKGNFSVKLGKWTALGMTKEDAMEKALLKMQQER